MAIECACCGGHQGIEKARRGGGVWLNRRNRSVDTSARAMQSATTWWLQKYGRRRFADVQRHLKRGGVKELRRREVRKISASDLSGMEQELFDLLQRFGFAQFNAAGTAAAGSVKERWHLRPQVAAEMNDRLANKVVLLVEETEVMVRDSIKQIVSESLRESPQPTSSELARRIARQWMGPPSSRVPLRGSAAEVDVTADWRRTQAEIDAGGRENLFSFTRAQTIARTELAQAENAGIAEGFAVAGVDKVRWLAYNDGKSGKRQHNLMLKHPPILVVDMQGKDPSKWFKLPSGIRTPYPNWIGLPAGETVNCRCLIRPD